MRSIIFRNNSGAITKPKKNPKDTIDSKTKTEKAKQHAADKQKITDNQNILQKRNFIFTSVKKYLKFSTQLSKKGIIDLFAGN